MIFLTSILLVCGTLVLFAALLVLAQRWLLNYGQCTIHVEGREIPLTVTGGEDLLTALASADIHVPSLCGRRGTCGHCKVTVLAGGEPVLPTELLYLSPDEIRAGIRLACQLRVRTDLRIRLSSAMLSARRYRARLAATLDITPSLRELRLHLIEPDRLVFSPGQYIQVEVPSPSDEPIYRAYSVASPVYDTVEPALDVELIPGGVGSTWLHRLQVGQELSFTGPYGEFRLSEDPEVEIVCVAGGCGLAPMKSIIYSVLDRFPGRTCWLFCGFRDAAHAFHLPLYQRLAQQFPQLRFLCALSASDADARRLHLETGPIHEILDRQLQPGKSRQAYVCGPPEMLAAVTKVLKAKGVNNICSDSL